MEDVVKASYSVCFPWTIFQVSGGLGVPKFRIERQKFANPRAPKNIQNPSPAFKNVPTAGKTVCHTMAFTGFNPAYFSSSAS
jgi:hypothetical protein